MQLAAKTPIPTFTWVFVIKKVHNVMRDTQQPGWWWRWYLFPLVYVQPPVGEIRQGNLDLVPTIPQGFAAVEVDLDELAFGSFDVEESVSIMET